jgi:ribonuclease HI
VKSLSAAYLSIDIPKSPMQIENLTIDKSKGWCFFYGARQGLNELTGAGAILYLSDDHSVRFKAGLGNGSNNHAELMVHRSLLICAEEKNVNNIQIFYQLGYLIDKWRYEPVKHLSQAIQEAAEACCKFL